MTSGSMMVRVSEPDFRAPMQPGEGRGFPLLVLFGKGEATLILTAAWAAAGRPSPGPWLLGAWLLTEAGWPALRRLLLELYGEGKRLSPEPPSFSLPYLRSDSPADLFLRTIGQRVREIRTRAREDPEFLATIATALAALGIGIGLVGGIGAWLTLGVGVSLLLGRRLGHPGIGGGIWRWVFGAFPWWLGLAGGNPSAPALVAGIPIGLAWVGFQRPAVGWVAWPLWVAWAVALSHGPGAYGLALIGLLLQEDRICRSRRAQGILWALALILTAWIVRTLPA